MIKRLFSRDKKYHIDIDIKEYTDRLCNIEINEEPIIKLFLTSASFFPIINSTVKYDHISLIKRKSLSIDVSHKGRFTPSVDVKSGKINFHVNFLKYLWAMTYSLFSYAHNIIELESKQQWNGNIRELKKSFEIFFMKEWARMLINSDECLPWIPHLPVPDIQNDEIKSINSIFHITIAYIYYHELSHIVLKHDPSINEISLKYEMEKEADNNALSILIGNFEEDQIKRSMGIGICIAIDSLLFIQDFPASKGQQTHPDPDQRLYNVIDFLDIQDQLIKIYLKRFVTLVSEFFFLSHGIKLPNQRYSSTDELYKDIFDVFDNMKV